MKSRGEHLLQEAIRNNDPMPAYLWLLIGIVFEVIGTCLLKYSAGFKSVVPTIGLFVCYPLSLYFAAVSVEKGIPPGAAYALCRYWYLPHRGGCVFPF